MKKRISTQLLLMSCCFILFLCNVKSSQAETYVPVGVDWTEYEDLTHPGSSTRISDKNYIIFIDARGAAIYDAYVPGTELIIPDSVEYKEKTKYFFTRFSPFNYLDVQPMPYQSIIFPDCMKEIELNRSCTNVKKINIPKSMKRLSISVEGPANVQFVVPNSMDHYIFKNNALYSKQDSGKLVYPLNIPEKYSIAEGTTSLSNQCFDQNNVWRYVKEITCPASLTTLDGAVFANCSKLETVDMKKLKVKVLSGGTFNGTPSLKKVSLPKTLKKIDQGAFWGSGISNLSIPSKVTTIGDRAFMKCSQLKKITFEGTKKMPKFATDEVFRAARPGIKFYVKNKKMAKQLKKNLKKSGVKKAKIYAGKKKKLVYKNING